jgi:TolA-binding protein
LRVSLRDQTSTIAPNTAAVAPQAAEPTVTPGLGPPPATSPAPASRGAWFHRGWDAALTEGRAKAVLSDAERRGLLVVLDQADSDDLWALANAARYAGRSSVASRALAAQRRRFPSSERALEAAFLLGRLYDRSAQEPAAAMKWYDRYLVEAPNGPQASDALGRKMTLLERWNRRADAVAVAEEYLRRFPLGTYATAARVLVRASTAGR